MQLYDYESYSQWQVVVPVTYLSHANWHSALCAKRGSDMAGCQTTESRSAPHPSWAPDRMWGTELMVLPSGAGRAVRTKVPPTPRSWDHVLGTHLHVESASCYENELQVALNKGVC